MRQTFRQSMTWLHTWAGLLLGWLLFFVFLTGTLGYVNTEIDHWMRPERPMVGAPAPVGELAAVAERRLRERSGDADTWRLIFSERRGITDLSIGWRSRPVGERPGRFTNERLDPQTGLPSERIIRATGGGNTLYRMHYELHYISREWAIRLVGLATMFMLVAICTGVVAHKKIFADFFTFRPRKGQRSWLDAHNVLAVTALPFHVMITWSGLVFFLFTYMPVAIDTLYPEGPARAGFFAEAHGELRVDRDNSRPQAPLVSLAPLLGQIEDRRGTGTVWFVIVDNPGRDNARISVYMHESGSIDPLRPQFRFDGVSGALLEDPVLTQAGEFNRALLGLHEGRFADPLLRLLYVIAGIMGTVMIGAGLVLWTTKRKAKLEQTEKPHFGLMTVDVLNLGTIIGLPIGIAAYFWVNRLLPVEMPERAAWETHAMFIAWGLTFAYAAWRPPGRAWLELCWIAAASCALLPLLNALTTDRHLGVSITAGDWVLAGFDLSAFAAGLFFCAVAGMMRRKRSGRT